VKETGESGSAVYNYGRGERLTTQYQILVNSRPVFFLQRVTPTSEIYSKVNSVFSIQNVKIVSLVAAASIVTITFKMEYYLKKGSKKKNARIGRFI
jgi:hypothetical protein